MSEQIKRYDCTNGRAQHCYGCYQMTESEYGDYVEFEEHSRIVAAKDAEIAQWREQRNDLIEGNNILHAELETERQHAQDQHSAWTVCDAERQQLRAQHARQVGDVQLTGEYHADVNMLLERIPRQVGGDEREQFEAWAQQNGISITRTPQALAFANGHRRTAGDYIMVEALCAYAAWQARAAALAPAAVADEVIRQELEELKKWAIAQGRPKCGVKGCERLADSPWTNCREHWR